MNAESRQLRGWKEIASHLRVSERSAKRWEQSRGLPVRRMAGSSRDAVFAFTEDLDSWLLNHEAAAVEERRDDLTTPLVATTDAPGTGPLPPAGTAARARKAGVLVMAAVLLFALMVAVWLFRTMAATEGAKALTAGSPANTSLEVTVPPTAAVSRRLKISFPNQPSFELTLVDGACGGLELEPPQWLELCSKPRGDRLLLEARVLPTRASVEARTALRPFNVVLELHSRVRTETPVLFDVEWIASKDETSASTPAGPR